MSENIVFGDIEERGMKTVYSTAHFIEDDVEPMPAFFTEDLVDYLFDEISKHFAGEVWVLVHKDVISRFSYETEDAEEIENEAFIKDYIHQLIDDFRRRVTH